MGRQAVELEIVRALAIRHDAAVGAEGLVASPIRERADELKAIGTPAEHRQTGRWWNRQLVGTFYGPAALNRT